MDEEESSNMRNSSSKDNNQPKCTVNKKNLKRTLSSSLKVAFTRETVLSRKKSCTSEQYQAVGTLKKTRSSSACVQKETIKGMEQPPVVPQPGRRGRMTNQLQFLQTHVLTAMWKHPSSWSFQSAVNAKMLNLPSCHGIIERINLSYVKVRLENFYYRSGSECIEDLKKIFSICYIYDKHDEFLVGMAQTQENIFLDKIKGMPDQEVEIELPASKTPKSKDCMEPGGRKRPSKDIISQSLSTTTAPKAKKEKCSNQNAKMSPPRRKMNQIFSSSFSSKTTNQLLSEIPKPKQEADEKYKMVGESKQWHDTYERLDSRLKFTAKILEVKFLSTVLPDPQCVASQVEMLHILREEFSTQQPLLDSLVNVVNELRSESTIKSANTSTYVWTDDWNDSPRESSTLFDTTDLLINSPIVNSASDSTVSSTVNSADAQKLHEIIQRWRDQLALVEKHGRAIHETQFHISLNQLRDTLWALSDRLDDQLLVDKDSGQQQDTDQQLEDCKTLLANFRNASKNLCQFVGDQVSKSNITAKLKLFEKLYDKLSKRKVEIEKILVDERQFETSCRELLGWLNNGLNIVTGNLFDNTDRHALQEQCLIHEGAYQCFIDKEADVEMILTQSHDVLAASQKLDSSISLRDELESKWDRYRDGMLERRTKLLICKKYYPARDLFSNWLREVEDKLESLKLNSFKHGNIRNLLKELLVLRLEVSNKSDELETVMTLGNTFVSACYIDEDDEVKKDLSLMKARWNKLSNCLRERTDLLTDTDRQLASFEINLRTVTNELDWCGNQLSLYDTYEVVAKDPKHVDRIKKLQEKSLSLNQQFGILSQQAIDLVEKARREGVNASHYLNDVNGEVADRIVSLKAKIDNCHNNVK